MGVFRGWGKKRRMMQTHEGFIERLHAVKQRFADEPALNHEALDELEHAILRLQQTKQALEESPDYVAAQKQRLEEERQRRMDVLRKTISDAKSEAQRLLGFPIDSRMDTNVYAMLPDGHVDQIVLKAQVQHFEAEIDQMAARTLTGPDMQRKQAQDQIAYRKAALMWYLMRSTPIDVAAFHAKLHPHLDVLIDALRELRELESTPGVSVTKR